VDEDGRLKYMMEKYPAQKIIELRCTKRYCDNVIGLVYDDQFFQSGGVQIYHSFKPFCSTCNRPSAVWRPSEIDAVEGEQSRLEFRREILRSLNESEKFKKKIK
jgi:hypothetical protein